MQKINSLIGAVTAALVLFTLPATSFAHTGETHIHSLLGWDHLAAMLAIGLWAGQKHIRQRWQLPVGFALMMTSGVALALTSVALPAFPAASALLLLLAGLMLLSAHQLSNTAAITLLGGFAVFHGYQHAAEAALSIGALAILIFSTLALHLAGVVIASKLQQHHAGWLKISGIGLTSLAAILLLAH